MPRTKQSRDKADRATNENVLDPSTNHILRKMIDRGDKITEMEGVISAGKEANVYGGHCGPEWRAIKIYRTAVVQFRDRERYVVGDHRVTMGYDSNNNREMIKAWALKEFRNLKRMQMAGIPAPTPLAVENNVLVMTFLGNAKGLAYPRLRDVVLEGDNVDRRWRDLYVQVLGLMRRLYRACRLVHADLSEYNMLYHDGRLYLIDVSQSVEHEHPAAMEFLRMDIKNVGNFFRRQGVNTLPDRKMLDFIIDRTIPASEPSMSREVERLFSQVEDPQDVENDNVVFRATDPPRTLDEAYDYEVATGGADLEHRKLLTNMVVFDKAEVESGGDKDWESDGESGSNKEWESDGESGSESDSDSRRTEGPAATPRGKKHQDKDVKKAHKMAVKDEQRERRKNKIPKHVKKKMVKDTARKTR